jgi:hypothetical protein
MGQAKKIERLTKKHDEMVLMLQCLVTHYGSMEIDLQTMLRVQDAEPEKRKVHVRAHGTSIHLTNSMPPLPVAAPKEKDDDGHQESVQGDDPTG